MAEDLLGVAFAAAAGGTGSVGRPRIDKGIDLYLRRLRTMLIVPIQVKASLVVGPDGAATYFVPEEDLRMLANGFVAFVHIPAPHDQLYERTFLVPIDEFRKRSRIVAHHRIPCYEFRAQFAGEVDEDWATFAVDLDQLSHWIARIPGWTTELPAPPAPPREAITKAETYDVGALGSLWAEAEVDRAAVGQLVIIEDRTRLDTVTVLVHDLNTHIIAGLHIRTAVITDAGTIHFDVQRPHFFVDATLWVLVVFLGRDLRVREDFVLLVPSAHIPALGFSETITLDPLTQRFRRYQVPASEFGKAFMDKAFGNSPGTSRLGSRLPLRNAS